MVEGDDQFKIVVPYIFTNPVSLIEPSWKENGIKNRSVEEIIKFLEEEYRWSGYKDCIGVKNFSSVTQRDFLLDMMGGVEGLKNAIRNYIELKKDIGKYKNLFLD